MNHGLYDHAKGVVLNAVAISDETTTKAQMRHLAHDAVVDLFSTICRELRKQPDLNLEQALFEFGERL